MKMPRGRPQKLQAFSFGEKPIAQGILAFREGLGFRVALLVLKGIVVEWIPIAIPL